MGFGVQRQDMDSQQPIFLIVDSVDIKRRNASKSVNHCDFLHPCFENLFFCFLFRDSFKLMFSGLYLLGQIACSFWFKMVSEFLCLFFLMHQFADKGWEPNSPKVSGTKNAGTEPFGGGCSLTLHEPYI